VLKQFIWLIYYLFSAGTVATPLPTPLPTLQQTLLPPDVPAPEAVTEAPTAAPSAAPTAAAVAEQPVVAGAGDDTPEPSSLGNFIFIFKPNSSSVHVVGTLVLSGAQCKCLCGRALALSYVYT
jgi:hypothetical protein